MYPEPTNIVSDKKYSSISCTYYHSSTKQTNKKINRLLSYRRQVNFRSLGCLKASKAYWHVSPDLRFTALFLACSAALHSVRRPYKNLQCPESEMTLAYNTHLKMKPIPPQNRTKGS